jgi:hypothetical protein
MKPVSTRKSQHGEKQGVGTTITCVLERENGKLAAFPDDGRLSLVSDDLVAWLSQRACNAPRCYGKELGQRISDHV